MKIHFLNTSPWRFAHKEKTPGISKAHTRLTSIYQPTNAYIISHKTLLKHFKTLQHVSILSDHHQGALFLAQVILHYSQFNSYLQTRCCGSISCCVGMCCEYCNITLARNKAPWWWSDKIETCRSILNCLKVFYVKLYVHSLVDKLKWFYENARCYNKTHTRHWWIANLRYWPLYADKPAAKSCLQPLYRTLRVP